MLRDWPRRAELESVLSRCTTAHEVGPTSGSAGSMPSVTTYPFTV
jgi:hypothetical protein